MVPHKETIQMQVHGVEVLQVTTKAFDREYAEQLTIALVIPMKFL
jgi:hypothetical protein